MNAGLMPHSPHERGKIDDWNRTIACLAMRRGLP
jgi:hypothetical protein